MHSIEREIEKNGSHCAYTSFANLSFQRKYSVVSINIINAILQMTTDFPLDDYHYEQAPLLFKCDHLNEPNFYSCFYLYETIRIPQKASSSQFFRLNETFFLHILRSTPACHTCG